MSLCLPFPHVKGWQVAHNQDLTAVYLRLLWNHCVVFFLTNSFLPTSAIPPIPLPFTTFSRLLFLLPFRSLPRYCSTNSFSCAYGYNYLFDIIPYFPDTLYINLRQLNVPLLYPPPSHREPNIIYSNSYTIVFEHHRCFKAHECFTFWVI